MSFFGFFQTSLTTDLLRAIREGGESMRWETRMTDDTTDQYVRTSRGRSWHLWSGLTSRGGMAKTFCGRWTLEQPQPDYPANERTCEGCFRVKARREENEAK